MTQLGIRGEQNLETAVQPKSLMFISGHASAHPVGGFQQNELAPPALKGPGTRQARGSGSHNHYISHSYSFVSSPELSPGLQEAAAAQAQESAPRR